MATNNEGGFEFKFTPYEQPYKTAYRFIEEATEYMNYLKTSFVDEMQTEWAQLLMKSIDDGEIVINGKTN